MTDNFADYMKRYPHICYQRRWTLDFETIYRLGQCEAIVSTLALLPLTPSVRREMLRVSLIKGATATTSIEGNTLSEEDVRKIDEGTASIPESRRYQEKEVSNVLNALNTIMFQVVKGENISRITPELIREFNRQVGEGIDEQHFRAVAGSYRMHEVSVGNYRPPEHQYVSEAMRKFCDWLPREFMPSIERQSPLYECIIEAIVSHVYLVWIHPFGDGNGRTARLVEFYLLLRGGVPDICSHVLSNHYNETRGDYYAQLINAGKSGDLSSFIKYAVGGLLDGLKEVLKKAQSDQITNYWRNYLYSCLDAASLRREVRKRFASLLVSMDINRAYTIVDLRTISAPVVFAYAKLGERQLAVDVKRLVDMGLIEKIDNMFHVQTSELFDSFARKRRFLQSQ